MEPALLTVLQDIHSAIDKELKAIKRHGATSRMTLFSGRKTSTDVSRGFLYRFEMLIQRNLPDGSQGVLRFQNRSAEAKVVAIEGQVIWLELAADMGERIPQASYEVDLAFLLEDLKSKYSTLANGSGPSPGPGIDLLLKRIPEVSNQISPLKVSLDYLSYEQIKAVENLLSLPIGAIHGPPGTGKTRTLAGALVECFASEEKILVCGYTNRAVDEALDAFKKAARKCLPGQLELAIKKGRILRKGVSVFPEEDPPVPTPEEAANMYKSSIERTLDDLRKRIRDIQEALKAMKALAVDLIRKEGLRREQEKLISELRSNVEQFQKNEDTIASLYKLIDTSEKQHTTLEKEGVIRRLLSAKERRSLSQAIARYKAEKQSLEGQQGTLVRKKYAIQEKRGDLEKKILQIEFRIRGKDTKDLQIRIMSKETELAEVKKEASYLEQTLDQVLDKVIEKAFLIFATLSRAHIDKDLSTTKYDRVFIDEASMASLPQLLWASLLARKAVCIFGDPNQLAPICISNDDSVRGWFARNIYQYAGLDSSSRPQVSRLTTQRRMPPELGDLVSNLFYKDELEHDWRGGVTTHFQWLGDRKVAILDTSDQGPFCNRHEMGRGYSRLNVVHTVIALAILQAAEKKGPNSSQMAYITPYRAQAEFFGALVLKKRQASEKTVGEFLPKLRWGTVHRFQGGQADLVIYDTCESPKQLPTKLTGGTLKVDTHGLTPVAL